MRKNFFRDNNHAIQAGLFWQGWWIWAALIFLVGRRYAEPLDQITQVDKKRKILGVLA